MNPAPRIAVCGASRCDPATYEQARQVGELLARAGAIVLTGGLGGVMEAACRGAREAGGLTVGILPGEDVRDANRYVWLPIATGMGQARNVILVLTASAVVAIAGEAGTLSEIALALKMGRPVVALASWRLQRSDGKEETRVHAVFSPQEAAALALRLAL
ncbi:MAG: TIGR00725 family protein [Chloroflexia bacterium]